jgi:hypothetical protein
MMDEFIDGIKGDVRQEQLLQIWKNYGNYIIGALLGAILLISCYLFWQSHVARRLQEESAQFESVLQLIEANHKADAEARLQQLSTTASDGYKILSLFELAKLKESQGQDPQEIYKKISQDKTIPEAYRQLADYYQLAFQFEKVAVRTFLSEVEPFLKQKSPWISSLKELKALALLKASQPQEAQALFEELSESQDAPNSLRLRAYAMAEKLR